MTQTIDIIKQRYHLSLPEKLNGLLECRSQFETQELPLAILYKSVHRIAGSSGMYGYSKIHAAAQACDAFILKIQPDVAVDGCEPMLATQIPEASFTNLKLRVDAIHQTLKDAIESD